MVTDRVLVDTNIPRPFQHTLIEDYRTKRRGSKSIVRQIEEWAPTARKPGLLLEGVPNLGKTMLAAAVLNEEHEGWHLSKGSSQIDPTALTVLLQKQWPVYFIQLAEFIELHQRCYGLHPLVMEGKVEPDEYLETDQLLQDLNTRVKMLVVDDVGKEYRTSTGFAENKFDLLVRTRHNAGLATIYTTNVPLKRWEHQYSDSMRSIIERSSLVLNLY